MAEALKILRDSFGVTPRGIIHVGANRGQEVPSYRDSGIRPVVLVEPLDEPYRQLVETIGGSAGFFPVQACLSTAAGRLVTFHIASNNSASSSYLEPTRHREIVPSVHFTETIELTTSTLDDVVAGLVSAGKAEWDGLDYLGIDTQGSELDILRGAPEVLKHVNSVYTEVSLGDLYAGSCSVYDLFDFLRPLGFHPYSLSIGALSWGDALFIRQTLVERHRSPAKAVADTANSMSRKKKARIADRESRKQARATKIGFRVLKKRRERRKRSEGGRA